MAYTVAFNAGALFRGLNNQIKQAMADALEMTARNAQSEWQEAALRAKAISADFKDRYSNSVKYEVNRDRLTARIFSDDPMATPIETGMPARDMKKALDTSIKVRAAKQGPHAGQRYLIIPMRANSPGNNALAQDMPPAVYRQARQLAPSTVRGMIPMRSGLNASDVRTKGPLMTMRSTYNWGGRLGNGPDVPKRFRGMYRFNTSSGNQTSSKFLSFRVMGEWSPGWIQPARPGQFIVRGVAEHTKDMLAFNIADAISSAAGR
ncbi:MAG: hypothetical protein ACOYNZ_07315 [Rhodoferax sp.]